MNCHYSFPRFCCWSHIGKWHHHCSTAPQHLFIQKGIENFTLTLWKKNKISFPQNVCFASTSWRTNLFVFLAGTSSSSSDLQQYFLQSFWRYGFCCFRIVKARIQQRIECYEVEWQNVQLGETCPTFFVTIETREENKIVMIIMTN